MRKVLTAIAVLVVCNVTAWMRERPLPPDLSSLVEAERAFARLSVERGVRDAFLASFAEDGIAFLPHPINAIKAYGSLPVQAGRPEFTLNWAPVYGDISAAGDLGYSTGPAVITDSTSQQRPARHLLFFSIWQMQGDGRWRVALDLGVRLDHPYAPLDAPYRRAPQWKPHVPEGESHAATLMQAEREFLLSAASVSAWRKYLRKDALVCRDGRMPQSGKDWMAASSGTITGEAILAKAARSGDLGYSYGRYRSGDREQGYFARVWKRDTKGRWRIVFDVGMELLRK